MTREIDCLGCELFGDRTRSSDISCCCGISISRSDGLLVSITEDDSLCFEIGDNLVRESDTHDGTEHDGLYSAISKRCYHIVRSYRLVCLCMIVSDLIVVVDMLEFVIGDTSECIRESVGEIMEIALLLGSRDDNREDMETTAEIVEEFADTEMIGRCTERSEDDIR